MKKLLIIISSVLLLYLAADYVYYRMGVFIALSDKPTEYFAKVDGKIFYMKKSGAFEPFEIKGVNLGSGIPAKKPSEFAIDADTYTRWFRRIQDMGANTVRVYTIQNADFYNAFYDYNKDNPEPLYMLCGVEADDYAQNSREAAYSDEFYKAFSEDAKAMVDVIHGRRKIGLNSYKRDVSEWVTGYILGSEWVDVTAKYTDDLYEDKEGYASHNGRYMYTTEEATPFETMLAKVGDAVVEYETKKYHTQRPVAFSNTPTTDAFDYPESLDSEFLKCASVDVEHIKATEEFKAGQFVSYHVYPDCPDYMSAVADWTPYGVAQADFTDEEGRLNTYRAYLTMLNNHHSMPVVIAEFGASSGRGTAHMSEQEQGEVLKNCYEDIKAAGCAGSCIFAWQDEWFKSAENTMYAVNLKRTPYWSDYQTGTQYFGLLSFDTGSERSVSYTDGDTAEWSQSDVLLQNQGMELSVKYDERFIYFLIKKPNLDLERDTLYIPLDITPKSGSRYAQDYNLKFENECDFLVVINGKDNSRVLVQERYEALRANYAEAVYGFNTYVKSNIPDKHSPEFVNINMILKEKKEASLNLGTAIEAENTLAETFETGKLTYGNANPESAEFNSLADFCQSGDYIELKLPWQLLNFSDPSKMEIHDDYYENYGVEAINTDGIYIGISLGGDEEIPMSFKELKGWGNKTQTHERLKSSYYTMQNLWR